MSTSRQLSRREALLRAALVALLVASLYAPIELLRLIMWHHETYRVLSLIPAFVLEVTLITGGLIGTTTACVYVLLGNGK